MWCRSRIGRLLRPLPDALAASPDHQRVEPPVDAVRLWTSEEKRFRKMENATALMWPLLLVAEPHFRRLNAPPLCTKVYAGVAYQDGVRVVTTPARGGRAV